MVDPFQQLGAINPIDNAQDYDFVDIGGQVCPGICELSGFKRVTEWDVKKGKGTKGGTATLTQLPPAKGSIKFLLWRPTHFDTWNESFRAQFKYDPTKKTANAVDIFHPWLAEIDIHSVVTESIGAVTNEGKGLYSITVELLEYLPPPKKSATGTPTGSTADKSKAGKSGKSDDPISDVEQAEVGSLLDEARGPKPRQDLLR